MDPFLGEIKMFAGNYAPENWALCNGQLLSISDYSPLYSLIGTTYGGDSVSTFAVPDLQGRAPLHNGTGTGLTARALGSKGGSESVSLTAAQLPLHTHALMAQTTVGTATQASGNLLSAGAAATNLVYTSAATPAVALTTSSIANSAGGAVHENRMPYQTVNFIICLMGIYPSEN